MDPVLARPIPAEGVRADARPAPQPKVGLQARLVRLSIAAVVVLILVLVALFEIRMSNLQALVLSRFDRELRFKLESGPGPDLRAPDGGPYDTRLGYTRLPGFVQRLPAVGYTIDSPASPSPTMREMVAPGLVHVYPTQ